MQKPTQHAPAWAITFQSPVHQPTRSPILCCSIYTLSSTRYMAIISMSARFNSKQDFTHIPFKKFDINLSSAEAKQIAPFSVCTVFHKPSQLVRSTRKHSSTTAACRMSIKAKALATGIDLSDMGYKEGEAVSSLFIQGTMGQKRDISTPIFIAGFPGHRWQE